MMYAIPFSNSENSFSASARDTYLELSLSRTSLSAAIFAALPVLLSESLRLPAVSTAP
jgi:hypothetical protein